MTEASPFAILQQQPPRATLHPHETFTDAARLEARLRATVKGEVRFDDASRAMYATDASNYRQVPIGLVVPLTTEDVIATVAACREFGRSDTLARRRHQPGRSVLQRRGGHRLLQTPACDSFAGPRNRRMAQVEPGIVLDALRLEAEKHELTFAPDPATHSRCTLGGMIGNNSCGTCTR